MATTKRGTRYAFAAVESEGTPAYIIGRADEGEPGYTPMPIGFGSYEHARRFADLKNEDLGLSKEEAALIILSTMRRVGRA